MIFALFASLAGLAIGRILEHPSPDNISLESRHRLHDTANASNFVDPARAGLDFDPEEYASIEVWDLFVAKGDHLVCLMQATDKGAGILTEDTRNPPSAATQWTGDLKSELTRWFWHVSRHDEGWECDFEHEGLKEAFNAQGLDARPAFGDDGQPLDGHNVCTMVAHYDDLDVDSEDEWGEMKPVTDMKYKVDGKEYTATGAFYQFAMNKIDGAIIAKNINSPAVSVRDFDKWRRPARPGELPELRFCSDIYWGYWVRDNPNIRNLRVYGAHHVVNDNTVLLVTRALRIKGVYELSLWPGVSFAADTDEGKALIGSPIGATIAHMLVGHKAELGIKHITKVTVVTNKARRMPWGEDYPTDMHIFFTIDDVPAAKMPNDGPEGEKPNGHIGENSDVLRVRDNSRGVLRTHTMRA